MTRETRWLPDTNASEVQSAPQLANRQDASAAGAYAQPNGAIGAFTGQPI